jgi:hypothetical protein
LAFARTSARVTHVVRAVLCAPAVYVATYTWCGTGEALEIVVAEVRFHIAKAYDFRAQVALCCPSAVGELVRRQPREQELWVRRLGGIAFLRDLQMAEAAEDELAWADGGFVVGKGGE